MSDESLPAKTADSTAITVNSEEVNQDYEKVRKTLHTILDKSQEAIELIMPVVEDSEHPRAFEVLSNMLKNTADIAQKLMDHQKANRDLAGTNRSQNETPAPAAGKVETQNIFVGSATDLQNFLAQQEKKKEVIDVTESAEA